MQNKLYNNVWKLRYQQAHQKFQEKEYPSAYKDFGWISTQYPDVRTSNGLTRMIVNFLNWSGHRATRINVSGRLVEKSTKTESGAIFIDKKWIKASTHKGTADVSATINGKACMFEVKAGRDKPHPAQLKEQERERSAGGVYEFVYTADEFFELYDKIVNNV